MPRTFDVHFGSVDQPAFDWRTLLDDSPDDDAVLAVTPAEVVGILGFDPLELEKFNPNHDPETGEFASGGSGSAAPKMTAEEFQNLIAETKAQAAKLRADVKAGLATNGYLAARDGDRVMLITPSIEKPGMLQVTNFNRGEPSGHVFTPADLSDITSAASEFKTWQHLTAEEADAALDPSVYKFNPNHDERGRFSSGDGSGGSYVATGDELKAAGFSRFDEAAVTAWNTHVGIKPQEYKDALLKGLDKYDTGRVHLSNSGGGPQGNNNDLASVTARFFDKDYEPQAEMTRNYTRKGDELTVYHDEFVVVPSLQGKGFAKDVMANSMDMYKAMGVDRIDMDASLSVGGYAWAKYGFLPDKAHWKTFAEDITYEPPYEDLPKGPVKSGISKILSSDDPHGMWALADSTVGKSLLLETEWHGSLYLKDPEQMARFNSYINKKKK